MTRPLSLPFLALSLAASLGTTAIAQTPPARNGEAGARMADTPGLPRTAEEVQPWAQRMFTRLDANQDGALTADELAVPADPESGARGGARMQAMIMRSDADGDARVTVAELTAGMQRMSERRSAMGGDEGRPGRAGGGMMDLPRTAEDVESWAGRVFGRLDADQNGAITGNELAVLANPAVAAMGGSRMRAMIVQSDASRDSRISLEELTAGSQRMFTRMDRDGDGRLADDELPQPPAPPARPAALSMPPPADPMPFPDMPDGG